MPPLLPHSPPFVTAFTVRRSDIADDAYIVHFNYIVGSKKRETMKESKMWLLSDQEMQDLKARPAVPTSEL